MLAGYVESGAKVVCPRILLYPDTDTIQCDGVAAHYLGTMSLRHGFVRRQEQGQSHPASGAVEVDGCLGAIILAERAAVLEAGGFEDIFFFYFEDLEFNLKMRSLGYRVACIENAVAYHERGVGTPGLSFRGKSSYPRKRYYLSARNRLMTILIHYRLTTMAVLSPALLAYELLMVLFALRLGYFGSWVQSWRWQIANWPVISERRARTQAARKRSDADLLSAGPIPVAPGVVRSRLMDHALSGLSVAFDLYWRLARPILR